jgi:hypothetical protein
MIVPIGIKIRLISMQDPDPIPVGATGVVRGIESHAAFGTVIMVDWDAPNDHRKLNVCPPEDKFEVI